MSKRNLHEVFEKTLELFNDTDYDALLPFLHTDIIMKRVDDSGSVVGIGNVFAYLKGRQFHLRPRLLEPHIDSEIGEAGRNGQISGTAFYQDQSDKEDRIKVRFTFTFARDKVDEEWQLINTFAVPL